MKITDKVNETTTYYDNYSQAGIVFDFFFILLMHIIHVVLSLAWLIMKCHKKNTSVA